MPSQSDIDDQISRLKVVRSTLSILLEQKSRHGLIFVPPSIIHGIYEARADIRKIKATLTEWEVSFENYADDEDDQYYLLSPKKRKFGVALGFVAVIAVNTIVAFLVNSRLMGKEESSLPEIQSPVNEMAIVEAGIFKMGDKSSNDRDSWNEHLVYLDKYLIDVYEVTNEQYKTFIDATGRNPPKDWKYGRVPEGKEQHPVTFVSWDDANSYCQYYGKQLPTEAQWEKAARGERGYIWPWGNDLIINYANTGLLQKGGTVPVGQFNKGESLYGVRDMAGNVSEWVNDWYNENYYTYGDKGISWNPTGPFIGKYKVIRGSNWSTTSFPSYKRIGIYTPGESNGNTDSFGFRCACGDCDVSKTR